MDNNNFRLDRETRQLLTRTFISVLGSTAAAILGALAFRYIVVDRVMEDPSMNPNASNSTNSNDNEDNDNDDNKNNDSNGGGRINYRKERLKSLNLNKYEAMLATDVIFPDDVDGSLDDIGGMQSVLTVIKEKVLFPLTHQYLYAHSRLLQRPTGILLYGPPGTGKTLLAKAIARTSHAMFLSINVGNLQNKWYGETPKIITALFTLAKKLSPCILFLDEADGFLGSRGNGNEMSSSQADITAKTQFLQYWEGLTTSNTNPSKVNKSSSSSQWVLLIGATNRPEALDPAVLRRMPCQIHIGLPNYTNRIDILKVLLRYENCTIENLDLGKISKLTKGFSGSDLKEVVREAAMVPVRETLAQYNVYENSSILLNRLVDSPLRSHINDKGKTQLQQTTNLRFLRTDDLVYGVKMIQPSVLTIAYSTDDDDNEEDTTLPSNGDIHSNPPDISSSTSASSSSSSVETKFSKFLPASRFSSPHINYPHNNENNDVPCPQCLQSLLHLSQHQRK